MRLRYKVILGIIVISILLTGGFLLSKKFLKEEVINPAKVIDTIDSYGYTLDDRDTELMKSLYAELKEVLKEKDKNNEEYAKIISKLFIVDLFTLNNKSNKYDVGGYEYIWPDSIENYKLNVSSTLYKTIETDLDEERKQNLPEVTSIEVSNFENTKYTLNEKEFTAYKIELTWDYKEDLGYDNKAEVICILNDFHIYVVNYTALGK